MSISELSPSYFVAPQISVEEVKYLVEAGFTKVINNRPDGESDDQPSSEELRLAVESAGLVYEYNPVVLPQLSQVQVENQLKATDQGGKVLAFCRTGTRSSVLWVLMQNHAGEKYDELCRDVTAKGFDLERCQPAMVPLKR